MVLADDSAPLDMERLVRFLRNPVKAFFKERLGVGFWNPEDEPGDTEAFAFDGLENYQLVAAQLQHWPAPPQCDAAQLQSLVASRLGALQRAGDLPMAGLGTRKKQELQATLTAMASAWAALGQAFGQRTERIAVQHQSQGVVLRDWIDGVYQRQANASPEAVQAAGASQRAWVQLPTAWPLWAPPPCTRPWAAWACSSPICAPSRRGCRCPAPQSPCCCNPATTG